MKSLHLAALSGLALAGGLAAAWSAGGAPPSRPSLGLPIDCKLGETCEVQNYVDRDPGPGAKDYRCGTQTYEAHGGVDFRIRDMAAQRRGVAVLAAAAGKVTRLRDGVGDISVRASGASAVAGQECGNGVVLDHGGGWETQYCHLAKGSIRVKVGDSIAAGQPIARVGLSGNTEYPHLHLTVRRAGAMVDPFAPGLAMPACGASTPQATLWSPATARTLAYRAQGAVLNAGFANGPVPADQVEAGDLAAPTTSGPALVAYVRAINLKGGDVQTLVVKGPDGQVVGENRIAPLERAKAQYVLYAGKKGSAFAKGRYTATYEVRRKQAVVLSKSFSLTL